jgi:hypothetical protein
MKRLLSLLALAATALVLPACHHHRDRDIAHTTTTTSEHTTRIAPAGYQATTVERY